MDGERRKVYTLGSLLSVFLLVLLASSLQRNNQKQDELAARDGCISSMERAAKALDFPSLKRYEEHLVSSGHQLPCGRSSIVP